MVGMAEIELDKETGAVEVLNYTAYYTEYTWDDTGRVQTEMSYYADGTPRNHFDVFTYDEYGNQIMQERYQDGEVYWRISYVYEQLKAAE